MTAEEFIDRLEQQGLLEEKVVSALRSQIVNKNVPPDFVANLLVNKGHLTAFQAKKLMADGPDTGDSSGLEVLDEGEPSGENSELGLASATNLGDSSGLEVLDDEPDDGLTPVDDGLTPVDDGLTPVDEGLTPVSVEPEPLGDEIDLFGDSTDDPSGDDDPFGAAPSAGGGGAATATATEAPPGKKVKKHKFDTPLILIGGGGVIFLAILSVGLYFLLQGETADEIFSAGQEAYESESYGQAIARFQEFIDDYPDEDRVSLAHVRIGMATLRQNLGSSSWDNGLETAKEVLPPLQAQPAFGEARPELASLLPSIAEGFANRGDNAKTIEQKQAQLDLAEEAMTFVNNGAYIPSSVRNDAVDKKVDSIKATMANIRRDIAKEEQFQVALNEIDEKLNASSTREAYQVRRSILREYPGLEVDPRMIEAVKQIAETEQSLVRPVSVDMNVETSDTPTPWRHRIVMANWRGEQAQGVGEQVVPMMFRGSVFGVRASNGQVLWRRFVGFNNDIHPFAVDAAVDADIMAIDTRLNELIRLKSDSGQVVWRLPVGEPFFKPTVLDNRLLLPTQSGKVLEVDLKSGKTNRAVQFPQPLRTAPAGSITGQEMYQVGEHSNVYVLSSSNLQCQGVYYLGHNEGAVVTTPALVRGHLLVCNNAGGDYCLVHVLAHDKETGALREVQEPFRISGSVTTPPRIYSRNHVMVLTDEGGLHFYEVEPRDEKNDPVRLMDSQLPSSGQKTLTFPLTDNSGRLWVADSHLTLYEVQIPKRKIVRRWRDPVQAAYVAPLHLVGNVLYHARRPTGSEGVVVTACVAETGNQLWQTALGVPTVGLLGQSNSVKAVSANGNVFDIGSEAIQANYAADATAPVNARLRADSYTRQIDLGDGRIVFASENQRDNLLLYDPPSAPKVVKLDFGSASVTAPPVAFNPEGHSPGLLVATSDGRVVLVDPATGKEMVLPFQAPVEAGRKVSWQEVAVLPGASEFVATDDQRKIYRVTLSDDPQPNLSPASTRQLDSAIDSPLAAVKEAAYGVERGGRVDVLVRFTLPSLDFKKASLKGRVVWGPHRVGDCVLLVSNEEGLMCLAGGEKPKWTSPGVKEELVGLPLLNEGTLVLASQTGRIWQINAETGEQVSVADAGAPLASGPVALGSVLLYGGADGALYVLLK